MKALNANVNVWYAVGPIGSLNLSEDIAGDDVTSLLTCRLKSGEEGASADEYFDCRVSDEHRYSTVGIVCLPGSFGKSDAISGSPAKDICSTIVNSLIVGIGGAKSGYSEIFPIGPSLKLANPEWRRLSFVRG